MRSRRFARKLRPEISRRGKKKMGRKETTNVALMITRARIRSGILSFFFLLGVLNSSLDPFPNSFSKLWIIYLCNALPVSIEIIVTYYF